MVAGYQVPPRSCHATLPVCGNGLCSAAHTIVPMGNRRWFDPDDVDREDAGYLTDEERAFAAALADATAPLVVPDLYDLLLPAAIARDFHPENQLVAALGLSGWGLGGKLSGECRDEMRVGLLDFGVHFSGNCVRGGQLHSQCYDLCGKSPGPPLQLPLVFCGAPNTVHGPELPLPVGADGQLSIV